MTVACKACKEILASEYESEISPETVCPHCGELLKRNFTLQALSGHINVTGSIVNLVVNTYPEQLLKEVEYLIEKNQFSLAVVVAQMACEISSERALTRAFADKGLHYLEDSVGNLLPSRSLANEKVRKLYDALTGGSVYDDLKHIWQDVKNVATLRNAAVHHGKICSQAEAEDALKTAIEFVQYFKT